MVVVVTTIHGGNGRMSLLVVLVLLSCTATSVGIHIKISAMDKRSRRYKVRQLLRNHWFGKAGNNSNGGKCDIIEGLDANDQIIIIGASDHQLSIREQVDHKGVSGIGIYADGALKLFTRGNSDGQIRQMTWRRILVGREQSNVELLG